MKSQRIIFVMFAITNVIVFSSPPARKNLLLGGLSKGSSTSTTAPEKSSQQNTQSFSIKFVPLITLLAGLFSNILNKLGQFNEVNKFESTRRFDIADTTTLQQNTTETPSEEENGLTECDASHLGLWPDKSNNQRYYKCEIDPRTPAPANCINNYFRGKNKKKENSNSQEKAEVPGVRPCFLLSMMKCANGFKYSHKNRICIPDIVFTSENYVNGKNN